MCVHCVCVPCRAVPCRAVPCRAVPCRAVPCRAVPCRGVAWRGVAWRGVACRVVSCLVLSCLVLSCLVLSCLVLSCLVLSCLVLVLRVCVMRISVCVAPLGKRETPHAQVQHASVCTFKSSPCVSAKRPHVEHMRAFCQYTRRPFECTHGGVLNLSTGGLSHSPLLLLSFLSLFLRSFSLSLLSATLCSLLSALFSSLSVTMKMITRPVGSLCTHGSDLLQRQSVGFGPFLVWRLCSNHARNNCPDITVQASCHLEWSGPVSV